VVPLTSRPGAVQYIPLNLSLGLSFVIAGAIAWARRPENPTGVLMMLAGLAWFAARQLLWWEAPLPHHLGELLENLVLALLGHVLIVFPHGRARSQTEHLLIRSVYALAMLGCVVPMLFLDPRLEGCSDCLQNLLLIHGDHAASELTSAFVSVLALAIAATIVARCSRAGRVRARRPDAH
jgi:hypothetical protein